MKTIKEINENEASDLMKYFQENSQKNLQEREYDLASLFNFRTKNNPKYSLRKFDEETLISRKKINRALNKVNIFWDSQRNVFEVKSSENSQSSESSESSENSENSENSIFSDEKNINQFNKFKEPKSKKQEQEENQKLSLKNDYENLKENLKEKTNSCKKLEEGEFVKEEIQILKKEIKEIKDFIYKNLAYNKSCNEKKIVQFQDYLGFEAKAYKRSFEVYEIVIQYFTFMLKNFDNRLMREILNELLVQYGEDLIPNSFDIYCQFHLQNENLRDQKTLKEKMLEERNKKN
jgi:hypothetical protein